MTPIPALTLQSSRPAGEPPTALMIAFLAATVVLLAVDLWTARRGLRRAHVISALTTVPVFLAAVWFAEQVGTWWDFDPVALTVHLCFAITGFVLAFVVVGTGVLHLAGKLRRSVHRALAWSFTALVVLAAATGVLIFLTGQEKV